MNGEESGVRVRGGTQVWTCENYGEGGKLEATVHSAGLLGCHFGARDGSVNA